MQFPSGFAVFSPALLDFLYYMRLKYECRRHAMPTGFYSTYEELKQAKIGGVKMNVEE